ncbi:amidohydrolase family protein [Devosia neptuniae]|jgi:N-acetylglucosamine-6-phosphate deacetylase|uniref:N-acetylglucosamine-6-phosphate deacetylase n=1 Tax=Devosia TaxID=46913 RepID=UPI0022AECF2F|nr:amidohydrolase family protein [Devosia neptuniae]MCZ4345567.1 amidohydrolase family protein [Devosia neptuniae]|tara:strand:- start:2700 stop:3893 length:1194 start_codon:yes stop_codon:yes gene_type:complete
MMGVKQNWTGALVVTPAGVVLRDLLVSGDRIVGLSLPGSVTSADWQTVDCRGKIIVPGIIDVLQHGFDVNLYSDATPDGVADSSGKLLARGVTGFLPSIGCQPPAEFADVLGRLSDACELAQGARALGIHSEGPCFNSPGAHNPQNLQLPSNDLARFMLDSAKGRLAAVTIAPELDGAEQFIGIMKDNGVSVHLGHSQAGPDDVSRYVSWGIDAVTHMYDVMRTLPADGSGVHVFSLPDALLAEPDLALGVVADGIHTHPKLLRILAQLPADRVFLETDSMKYAGLAGTEFEFYPGYFVTSAPGKAVRDRDGGLCGSSLTPDEGLRNYMAMAGADLVRAAHAASLVPARVIGRAADMGSLEKGKLADFVVLDPTDLAVVETVIGGKSLYRREHAKAA